MLDFDFEIIYKLGCENKTVDALSRNPNFVNELHAVSAAKVTGIEHIQHEVNKDKRLQQIIQQLQNDSTAHQCFSFRNETLIYQGRVILPTTSRFIPQFLHEFHSSLCGGHSRYIRTYKRITSVFYWEGKKIDIKRYVRECEICQRMKYEATTPMGLLQPLPIPSKIWEDVSMGFIMGLPKVSSVDTILLVVDRLPKHAHFLVIKHLFIAKDIAGVFIREVVQLHGFPRTIVTD